MKIFLFYSAIALGISSFAQASSILDPENKAQSLHFDALQKQNIDCFYKIPVESHQIDKTTILSWANNAAMQSFNFNFESIDKQLEQLKTCYTEKGWNGFNTALHKSNNIQTIKNQKLIVSSQLDGKAQFIDSRENKWKITIPLKVVYHNENERVIHFINVYMSLGWKNSTGLGITQMITTPRLPPVAHKAGATEDALQSILSWHQNQLIALNTTKNNVNTYLNSLLPQLPKRILSPEAPQLTQNTPVMHRESNDHYHTAAIPFIFNAPATSPKASFDFAWVQHYPDQFLNFKKQTIKYLGSINFADNLNQLQTALQKTIKKTTLTASTNTARSQISRIIKEQENQQQLAHIKAQAKEQITSWNLGPRLNELNTALKRAPHIKEPKIAELTVERQNEVSPRLVESSKNQLNILLPIKVTYQGDKEQLTKDLNLNVVLNRTDMGELVVMQVNALQNNNKPPHSAPILLSQLESINTLTTRQLKSVNSMTCNFRITAKTASTNESLLLDWATYATTQSFNFNFDTIETQLAQLRPCYTEEGWTKFTTALKNSGNIDAIKAQKINMFSQIDGQPELSSSENNQWKISFPLTVFYQANNSKDKISQRLNVKVIVGRNPTDDIGIMQIIATLDKVH